MSRVQPAEPQNWRFETTEDGSWTLRLGPSDPMTGQLGEAMHSTKGAFSESLYIYGEAISVMLEQGWPPAILSIGLGLGYVEILAAALCLQKGLSPRQVRVESFEKVPVLREQFGGWLHGDEIHPEFARAYAEILQQTALRIGMPTESIRTWLQEALQLEHFNLCESWSGLSSMKPGLQFSCVCFDAFSSNTSPELWTAEILEELLSQGCLPQATFATYASTGHLKRALRKFDFRPLRTEGFGGKRESTLAIRD